MKKHPLLLILLTLALLLTACGSKTPTGAVQENAQATKTVTQSQTAAPLTTNRKLIIRANINIQVPDITKSTADTEKIATTIGGYVKAAEVNETSATMTLAIPAGNLEAFTERLADIGKIASKSQTSEDVTDQYFDTGTRIKNLEAELQTLRNLEQKSGLKISEILEIETEIRRLTDELESLKGTLANMDRQIQYNEVTINFSADTVGAEPSDKNNIVRKVAEAFKTGIQFMLTLLTWLIAVIGFLLPILPFVLIAYLIRRWIVRKRESEKNIMHQNKNENNSEK